MGWNDNKTPSTDVRYPQIIATWHTPYLKLHQSFTSIATIYDTAKYKSKVFLFNIKASYKSLAHKEINWLEK